MESESPIIIQMLKDVKGMIELSKGRGCWASEELPNINITYHNVCEIVKQLQKKDKALQRFEEIEKPEVVGQEKLDESVEQMDEMD